MADKNKYKGLDNLVAADRDRARTMPSVYVDRREKKKGTKYKPVGSNVYAKERKFFKDQSNEYVKQSVKDSDGKNKVYLKTHYPNGLIGGMTVAPSEEHRASVDGYPAFRNKPKNTAKTRHVATHEMKHVKDLAGTGAEIDLYNKASQHAKKTRPKKGGTFRDVATGQSANRYIAYDDDKRRRMARYEGAADKTATAKHKTPAWKVTGYPALAHGNDPFARGYREGGGKPAPNLFSPERKADKEQWKKTVSGISKVRKGLMEDVSMNTMTKSAFGPEIEKGLASMRTAADIGGIGRKAKKTLKPKMALDSVKRAKGNMALPEKAVANVAQYPGRAGAAAGATGVAGAGSLYGSQRVKKSDEGPFGIEVSKKAAMLPQMGQKGFSKVRGVAGGQVKNQLKLVGEQKGSKNIQLRHAKRLAGEKFQNK